MEGWRAKERDADNEGGEVGGGREIAVAASGLVREASPRKKATMSTCVPRLQADKVIHPSNGCENQTRKLGKAGEENSKLACALNRRNRKAKPLALPSRAVVPSNAVDIRDLNNYHCMAAPANICASLKMIRLYFIQAAV